MLERLQDLPAGNSGGSTVATRRLRDQSPAASTQFFAQPDVRLIEELTSTPTSIWSAPGGCAARGPGPGGRRADSPAASRADACQQALLTWCYTGEREAGAGRLYRLHPGDRRRGSLVAHRDNMPVEGLALTTTWQPGALIRDLYRLEMPWPQPSPAYRLLVRLPYDAEAAVPLMALPDGTTTDHLSFPLQVEGD